MFGFIFPLLTGGLLVLSMLCPAAAHELPKVLNGPPGSVSFGTVVRALPNGNIVVTDPDWTGPGNLEKAGAVYLYDGTTLNIISTLTGAAAGDQVGLGGVTVVGGGHYVVASPRWNEYRGAVTWCAGDTGVQGPVSGANSLTGTARGHAVGIGSVIVLRNGNYVVRSSWWNEGRGAVTWGSGTAGVRGGVSAANSLLGTIPNGQITVQILENGHYLVQTQGAVTWGSGTAGVTGAVSEANSLVSADGLRIDDPYGIYPIYSDGNYLVISSDYLTGRFGVTWGSGTAGVKGVISTANTLTGFALHPDIRMLSGGNYLVQAPEWNENRGAVTWGGAGVGVSGEVSAANSLVGTTPGDKVGSGDAVELSNGNCAVQSPKWNEDRGAVTWCGPGGLKGEVSAANSLIGTRSGDAVGIGTVTALINGNCVVSSAQWNNWRGAATLSRAATGWTKGEISTANSLVGSQSGDAIGSNDTVDLTQGNYVVCSSEWGGGRGAATWGSGTAGVTGEVSTANSLTGTLGRDETGSGDAVAGSVEALANGSYVVGSPGWNGGRGAATWGSGAEGVKGEVSPANSLTGGYENSFVGSMPSITFSNGDYVVRSPWWNGTRGAATWGSGAEGVRGEISAANSLIGTRSGDRVSEGSTAIVGGGNYVVSSWHWNEDRGAVTWGSGAGGVKGEVSAANSLTGTNAGDGVGFETDNYLQRSIRVLDGGHYLVPSPHWGGGHGAVTWGDGAAGGRGEVSAANSLLGTADRLLNSDLYSGEGGYHFMVGFRKSPDSAGLFLTTFAVGDSVAGNAGYASSFNSVTGLRKDPPPWGAAVLDSAHSRLLTGYPGGNRVAVLSLAGGIQVTGPQGADVLDESIPAAERPTGFGTVPVNDSGAGGGNGGIAVRVLSAVDAGVRRLILTGSPQVRISGPDAGDFTVTRQPSRLTPDAAHLTFEITFKPTGPGLRTATVTIPNNTGDLNPFIFTIRGTGGETVPGPYEVWRAGWASQAAAGTAPAEDFDGDGVSNLLEFAFNTDPVDKSSGRTPLAYTGPLTPGGTFVSAGGPVIRVGPDGSAASVLWVRRRNHLTAGLKYEPQFSADLQTWRNAPMEPVALAGHETAEVVTVPFPDFVNGGGGAGEGVKEKTRFFRLAVTLMP